MIIWLFADIVWYFIGTFIDIYYSVSVINKVQFVYLECDAWQIEYKGVRRHKVLDLLEFLCNFMYSICKAFIFALTDFEQILTEPNTDISSFTNRSTFSNVIITQLFHVKRHQLCMKESLVWYSFSNIYVGQLSEQLWVIIWNKKEIYLWGNRISINEEKQNFTID